MKKGYFLALLFASILAAGCGNTEDKKESEDMNKAPLTDVAEENVPIPEGYSLFWHDEFNGDKLNTSVWSKEIHKPGFVNHELQEYTVSPENIFVKDGCLTIKAIKTVDENGNVHYTSGRLNTNYAMMFTYGKVVVGAKVPKGKGLWPAAWMMPCSNANYGQWPLGGEIDIMEILGNDTKTAYSTIHYGLPHEQQQGMKRTAAGEPDYSEAFHEFSVEWEPGEIRFYIDGTHICTANEWFTKNYNQVPAPFPAPFDKDFHMILNLAVGGDWPGNPDETTDFDKAEYLVDYVRVYQKKEQ